ncbi:hypothetical protein [Streptomyces qinglanensis]|uniref:hypothetical protein n=1 Tax=Streptomyces qinglanensis TaxID=943816 RepID=UPI003D750A3A
MQDDRYAQRDLGEFGRLKMTSLADPATGAVRYWLTAPHVRGSVVLVPPALFTDPSSRTAPPCDLYVFARLDGPGSAGRYERPLSVNGIELCGRTAVRLDQSERINVLRRGRTGTPEPLPPRSRRIARTVLGAAAEHWAARSDRGVLHDLARRSSAQHFLSHSEEELAHRQEEVRRAQQALDETRQRIGVLRGIVATTSVS